MIKNQFKSITKSEIRSLRIGQWVRVFWEDVGMRDGVIIQIDDDRLAFYVIEPYGVEKQHITADQIIEIGPMMVVPKF